MTRLLLLFCLLAMRQAQAAPHVAVYAQVVQASGGFCGTFGANPATDDKIANGLRVGATCPSFCFKVTLVNDGTVDLQSVSVAGSPISLAACTFPATLSSGGSATCTVTGVAVCEDTTDTVVAEGQSASDSSPAGHVTSMDSAVATAVSVFPMDLAAFNVAAGNPPVVVDFDAIPPATDIGGQTIAGVTFAPSATGAPLFVVRASDTTTPVAGFTGIVDAATNELPATSGANVLSPGGATLGPGPNDPIENDDLVVTFATPVSAVGFDHLSQSADGFGFSNVTVFDVADHVLFSGSIPISGLGGGGAPAAADFWGIVSYAPDIARIEVDEGDSNDAFPDCNIGFDTIRVAGLPFTSTTTTTTSASTTTTLCDPRIAARRAIEDACGCSGSTNHGAYVRCVRHAVAAQVKSGMLPKGSAHSVKRCAARSTCGKSGFVTCCRTSAKGRTKCSIKHGAAKCRAPRHGSARVGVHASCCDACSESGCIPLD